MNPTAPSHAGLPIKWHRPGLPAGPPLRRRALGEVGPGRRSKEPSGRKRQSPLSRLVEEYPQPALPWMIDWTRQVALSETLLTFFFRVRGWKPLVCMRR